MPDIEVVFVPEIIMTDHALKGGLPTQDAGPGITALIAVHNEERWIERAVTSLLGQSWGRLEILVVDDASDDRTPHILANIKDRRLRVVRRPRSGQYGALAYGVGAARGEYIARLDADDEAYPERLAKQAAFLDAHPDHAWVGAGEERVDTQRGEHMMRLYPETDAEVRRMAARCIPYCHSAIMFRRSLLDEGLNYDASGSLMSDFVFFIAVARLHKVANLPEVLVRRHIRDESYYQRRFNRGMQNRRLARLSSWAVRELELPKRYYFYPLARLAYPYIPNGPKRLVRRVAGLAEQVARGGHGEGTEGTERAP